MNLPGSFLEFGAVRWLGIPGPVIWLVLCVVAVHLVLTRTPFGRHVYAVGHDAGAARKAGIPVGWVLLGVYMICGACAGLGGLLSLGQLGTVSPTFGMGKEFTAIAAAVLGGTSLFGGRGRVWPGTVLGALLMQSVENGLNIVDADPYAYPVVVGGIIFLAVLMDSARTRWLAARSRRRIRREG
jgi:ribose transport system permease protein